MKKLISLILSGLMMGMLLVSCGGKEITLDVDQAADTLNSALTYVGTMEPLAENMLDTTFSDIQLNDVAKFKAYVSTDATAEEAAVFEAVDEEAAGRIKKAMDSHVAEQKDIYSAYSPEGVERLNKAVVKQSGKYVILCVAGDGSKTAAEVDNLFK